jgi:hypothetical protein
MHKSFISGASRGIVMAFINDEPFTDMILSYGIASSLVSSIEKLI